MRNRLNKIISYIVVICFIYLIIFENKFNLDLFIMKKFECRTEEIIYFKCVMLIIISLIIMIIDKIIDKYAINMDLSLKYYIAIHPIRSIIVLVIVLTTILIALMFLLGATNMLLYVIPLILICFSAIIGFYIGIIKR